MVYNLTINKSILCLICILLFNTTKTYAQVDSVSIIHAKHIEALGGQENLDKIQSIKSFVKSLTNKISETTEINYRLRPCYERIDLKGSTGLVITCRYQDSMLVWNNRFGEKPIHTWEAVEKLKIKGTGKKMLKKLHFYNSFVEYPQNNYKLEYLGKELIYGELCFKIKVEADNISIDYFYINCDTYLLVEEYSTGTLSPTTSKIAYGDYRVVNGIKLPFKVTIMNGNYFSSVKEYEKIETNFTVDPRLFECMPLTQKIEDIKD